MCCGKSMASIVATDEFVGLLQVRELKGGGIPEQLVKRQVLSGLDVIRGGRVRGRAEHGDKLGHGHWRHIRAGAREHVGRRLGGAIPGRRHRFLPPQRRIAEPTDRGRDEGLTSPLPPNWTGGFPASSFPVSGFSARLTVSTRAVFQTKQPLCRKPSVRPSPTVGFAQPVARSLLPLAQHRPQASPQPPVRTV